jgi:tetratricopeptide (TPR) repeat protein
MVPAMPSARQAPQPPAAPGWYYAQNKKKHGPVTRAQLQRLASSGQLGPSDMVLQEGTSKWLAAGLIPELFAASQPAANGAPPAKLSGGWHYAKNKKKHGPVSWPLLEQLAATGQLLREDMVLPEGGKKWVLAGSIDNLFPSVSVEELMGATGAVVAELPKLPLRPRPTSPRACPHCQGTAYCGRSWDADGLLMRGPVCGKCKEKSGLASGQNADKVTCAVCAGKGFTASEEELDFRRDAVAWRMRALAASDSGRYEEAIAAYNEAIRLAPDFADAYYERGWAYMAAGASDLADADLAEAARLSPRYATQEPSAGPEAAKSSSWLPRLFGRS